MIRELPLTDVLVADRARGDLGDIDALAESIRQEGLLQPIVVRPLDERFQLIAGRRRLAALGSARVRRLLQGPRPHLRARGQDRKSVV